MTNALGNTVSVSNLPVASMAGARFDRHPWWLRHRSGLGIPATCSLRADQRVPPVQRADQGLQAGLVTMQRDGCEGV